MKSVELEISSRDWFFIVIIGAFFGLFLSLFFYFLNGQLHEASTIAFCVAVSIVISLYAIVLITLSNNFVLPRVNQRFWYLISFIFSFLSGALGFLSVFALFDGSQVALVGLITPFALPITMTIGMMTLLVGVILHQFISMKYKHESIVSQTLTAQIKALENELNPHFLFNTLNSICELIHTDKPKAEQTVMSLSKFLRNALDQKESLITLEEELSMLQTYLAIENVRFDDKIKVHITIDPHDYPTKVPKFSIQLIVENGIKHGYNGGELHFWITKNANILSIRNDGKITTHLTYGTGLTNLQARLELLGIGQLTHDTMTQMEFKITL